MLVDNIRQGDYNGWTVDYVLSELLGELKGDMERKKGVDHILTETLSSYEITSLVQIVEGLRSMPHLEVFKTPFIEQSKIYEKVRSLCIEAKDAIILISALQLRGTMKNIVLTTRDGKFLVRANKEIATAHPSKYLTKCPVQCLSKSVCRFSK